MREKIKTSTVDVFLAVAAICACGVIIETVKFIFRLLCSCSTFKAGKIIYLFNACDVA